MLPQYCWTAQFSEKLLRGGWLRYNDDVMDKDQFKSVMSELEDIRSLLILIASKSKATSDEIGKVLGVGGSQVRNILAEKRKR